MKRKIFVIISILLLGVAFFFLMQDEKPKIETPLPVQETIQEEKPKEPVETPKPVKTPKPAPPTPKPTPKPTPPKPVAKPQTLGENSVEALVNNERAKHGLGRYQSNSTLRSSACAKAQHMLSKQYWSHDAPDGTKWWSFIANSGYRYSLAGENLAHGYVTDAQAVTGWMNSPTHRANILGSFKEQGICSINGTLLGSPGVLIVQHLGSN